MAWRQEALRQTLEQVEAEQKTDRVVDAEPTTTSHQRAATSSGTRHMANTWISTGLMHRL